MSWPPLRYFDNEALMAYVELLHNLVERLGKNIGDSNNLSSAKDFSETSEIDMIPGKDTLREKPKYDGYQKAPKIRKNQVESLKEKADGQRKQQKQICTFCNRRHRKGKHYCSAFNRRCYKCNKSNHFAVVCRSKGSKKSKCGNTDLAVSLVEKQSVANESVKMKNSSDSKTRRKEWKKQSILHWMNNKLKVNHCALVELKDGKRLNELVGKVLGYEYSPRSSMPWQEIEDILLIEDMETHIPLDELKCCNEGALFKLIKWLQVEEAKRSR